MDSPRHKPLRIAYIAGTSYCGSTLTAFLLNAHPQVLSVGEMGPADAFRSPEYPCSCGQPIIDCPFYRGIGSRLQEEELSFDAMDWGLRHKISKSTIINRLALAAIPYRRLATLRTQAIMSVNPWRDRVRRIGERYVSFVGAALEAGGKEIFVDATKTSQRAEFLSRVDGIDLRLIHLVRDPRGFCNSSREMKRKNRPVDKSARLWVRANRSIEVALARMPPASVLRVRYEDLASAPEATYRRLSRFIGAEELPLPADYTAGPHHIVGNKMRLAGPKPIAPDESWRQHITVEEQARIGKIAGKVASGYGYDL